LRERGAFSEASDPEDGTFRQVAPVLAGMPRPQAPVAVRDANQTDTQALLAEAGLEPDAIERLRADGIIS
ncbi:MAG: CoA transferase, partial [Myxococcota bacterium]|nr:CoA transferase [Myxococcota bacterium]